MKMDPKSNFTIAAHIAAVSQTVTAHNGTAVDMSLAPACSFLINAGTIGSSGTVDAKLQHSDNNSTWTDEADTTYGNSTSITQITAAGSALLHVVNPRARYYRVVLTVGTAACVVGVTSVLGPLRTVAAE